VNFGDHLVTTMLILPRSRPFPGRYVSPIKNLLTNIPCGLEAAKHEPRETMWSPYEFNGTIRFREE
jgi:hypothetical protein